MQSSKLKSRIYGGFVMLHQIEKLLLAAMEQGRDYDVPSLAVATGLDPGAVMKGIAWLEEKGALAKSVSISKKTEITDEGKHYIDNKFPENRVYDKVVAAGENGAPMSAFDAEETRIGLGLARKSGWIAPQQSPNGFTFRKGTAPAVDKAKELKAIKLGPHTQYLVEFMERKLCETIEKKSVSVKLTESGAALRKDASMPTARSSTIPSNADIAAPINTITSDFIRAKAWKDTGVEIRGYNVLAPVEVPFAAKRHIVGRAIRRIKDIFLSLGFEEMGGSLIEAGFWNFDVLFQPQDHPARELADTFYLDKAVKLGSGGERALIKRVKEVHENAWGMPWLEAEASKCVLRTHTTAVSARYLAKLAGSKIKKKYFSVGKVYRNESIDFKHLAEFHQIEGIIVDENATFADLLGTLKQFYSRLGFEKIRFMPSYFPYTEPSLEIEVYFEDRKEWLELGGAGIFRPEVSKPLCGRYPVLAFGLSMERPLMLKLGISDIRILYENNMTLLREQ
ncbi:hypothetical protein COS70_02425 [Candidatus Micrarchaeota archaeon CG06_land_8_20_14_3_00_50_6]|nr:MAG: hypothetical protein COS70_02425 [Candidatus Micrarchaeota archaeon CG06_land_8_20_14_3_00_50_6]